MHFSLWLAAGHMHGSVLVDVDVHFAAGAEVGEVDARLDAEAGAADDAAVFPGLQPVHVCAIAVDLLADVASCPPAEAVTLPV